MKIVAISDTHTYHRSVKLDSGDVLCHAGDITNRGEIDTVIDFDKWMGNLNFKHKLAIAGNHDFCFEKPESKNLVKEIKNFTYLQDQEVVIDGVKFYGTPWQPWFYDWAFNMKKEEHREVMWSKIPDDTNVLIVHGPPHKYGDLCKSGDNPGCKKLMERIRQIKPKYVITGHIHEAYGIYDIPGVTTVVNASVCTLSYKPTNQPLILEL